jgi:hypothetical protein
MRINISAQWFTLLLLKCKTKASPVMVHSIQKKLVEIILCNQWYKMRTYSAQSHHQGVASQIR